MEPECNSWHIPSDKTCRVAMLIGATASTLDKQLVASTMRLKRQPKAAALRWCMDADPSASSVSAACIGFEPKKDDPGPTAKRQKTGPAGQQKAGSIFLRHILFRHQQLRTVDPAARRDG